MIVVVFLKTAAYTVAKYSDIFIIILQQFETPAIIPSFFQKKLFAAVQKTPK